jgi:hypothetical protein
MSAFMCEDKHLGAIASFAVYDWNHLCRGSHEDPGQHVLSELWRANVASLRARYPRDFAELVDDSNAAELPKPPTFRIDRRLDPRSPAFVGAVAVIKSIKCYRYQACEHEGWEGSYADKLTEQLLHAAIGYLPGYDAAAWGAP